jgi:hypothetical protein
MDVDADAVRTSASLGPISPELVLVDPVLAEQARELLPEPREQLRPRATPVTALAGAAVVLPEAPPPAPAEPQVAADPAVPAPRRRWRRMLVLAVLIFVAGAVSGTLLSGTEPESTAVTFEAQTNGPTSAAPSTSGPGAPSSSAEPTTTSRPTTTSKRATLRPPRQRHEAVGGWASNVLGVEARVEESGVTLVWKRPADSSRVAVLRARGFRGHGSVLFRGRAATYRDASARPCTAYRYTIVNYDRSGRRSTGVPTSVVTRCD